MKSQLTTEELLFYNRNNEVVKKMSRTAFGGTKQEVVTWGDFDKTFFTYDAPSKKIMLLPQAEYGSIVFNQALGNQNNQEITFCALEITNLISLGKFDYIIGLKRQSDAFIYKVEISIYMDIFKLSDAGSFHISTGKVNIAVGVYQKDNKQYIILAPSEMQSTLQSCAIYYKETVPTSTLVLGYQPTPSQYVII